MEEASHDDTPPSAKWVQPLVLSLLAGLSTCLGAACVFCLHRTNGSGKPPLRHGHMAFSLSLAGSVMVTVSFVSILPESLQDERYENNNNDQQQLQLQQPVVYHMIPIQSYLFGIRCLSFGVGCLLYVLLSKCAFPEPDAILGLDEEAAEARIALLLLQQQQQQQQDLAFLMAPPPPETKLVRRVTSSSASSVSYFDEEGASLVSSAQGTSPFVKRQSSSKRKDTTETFDGGAATANNHVDGEDKPPMQHYNNNNNNNNSSSSNGSSSSSTANWLIRCSRGTDLETNSARRAWRVTMLLFISLAVHNFPEGLAVAASTMHSVKLGLTTAVAIALHNIPEGIAIAVPCLAARPDSPWLAFWLASISGLAEPAGALVALFVLGNHATVNIPNDPYWLSMNNVLCFVSGIMTTVAMIELFPEAWRYNNDGRIPFGAGLLAGVLVMVGSDLYMDS